MMAAERTCGAFGCDLRATVHGIRGDEWVPGCYCAEHGAGVEPQMAKQPARGDWMQTYTGRAFYPLEPNPGDVDLLDIAHGLSMLCRYNGHVSRFYSVAEHCVLMSFAVAPEHALWALLHDATEAYLGDMIRPLKRQMPAYRAVEQEVMTAICDRFGLDYECPDEIKAADTRILRDERAALLGPSPQPWLAVEDVEPLGVEVRGWSPARAEMEYLARFAVLTCTAVHRG
jgi:hypothetical protein